MKKMVNDRITVIVNRYGQDYEIPLQLEVRP